MPRPLLAAALALVLVACARPARPPAPSAAVTLDLAQAEAALAIIRPLSRRQPAPDGAWPTLRATAGYRRLLERERAMRRELTDSAFRAFLESDTLLARAAALEQAVARWRRVDVGAAARRAAAYLPAGTTLRATLYPVIKPRTNSFVWELDRDPAFFVYVDPAMSMAEQENVVAHELHHVGDAAACPSAPRPDDGAPDPVKRHWLARRYAGAFAEGLAMLAAAGGPARHPHEASADSVRRRWDRDVANMASDMARLSSFFARTLDGTLATPDTVAAEAAAFWGTQGAWYTVGYAMARAIETAHGRERLVAVMCDPAALLRAYDEAAVVLNARGSDPNAERAGALAWPLPRWPASLVVRLGAR